MTDHTSTLAKPPSNWQHDEKTAFRGGAWCARREPDAPNPYENERLAAAWHEGFADQSRLIEDDA